MMDKKLVILDDDEIYAKILSGPLKKLGHDPIVFHNLHDLQESKILDEHPILLLDLVMPDISGIDALKIIRKDYSSFEVPILMISANDETKYIIEALNNGANDYLTKPLNLRIAKARIDTQIELAKLHDRISEASSLQVMYKLIATYNHEINNPLTIALGFMNKFKKNRSEKTLDYIDDALVRMSEVVKKIDATFKDHGIYNEFSSKHPDRDKNKKAA